MTNDARNDVPLPLTGLRLSRRGVLRLVAMAGSAPLAAGLLAACGSSSSSPKSAATTASTSSTGGSGSATQAAATSAPATSAATQAAAPGGSPAASPAGSAGSSKFTVEPAKHKGGQVVYGSSADAQNANPVL